MRGTKRRSKEFRVGIVILLALAIMISTVFFIGGQKKLFGGKVKYKILFEGTGGLYEGDPVLLTGVEVGNVVGLGFPESLDMKKIRVEIAVLKEVSSRIREDTRARIGSASLVYGKIVELSMGSVDAPIIPEGGFIEAEERTSYGAIVDSANLMVGEIRHVLSKFGRGDGMVGMLLNEPLELREILHNLSRSSHRLLWGNSLMMRRMVRLCWEISDPPFIRSPILLQRSIPVREPWVVSSMTTRSITVFRMWYWGSRAIEWPNGLFKIGERLEKRRD